MTDVITVKISSNVGLGWRKGCTPALEAGDCRFKSYSQNIISETASENQIKENVESFKKLIENTLRVYAEEIKKWEKQTRGEKHEE